MGVDTLAIARELRAAELPQQQAEAIAAAIGHSILESAATKADLELLRRDLLQVESGLEAKIDRKIEELKSTLLTWFIATQLTTMAIIIAAMKL